MDFIYNLIMFFSICAFMGWIVESVYKTFLERAFVNSGFLRGPFVPIYGFGAMFIYLTSLAINSYPFIIQVGVYTFLAIFLEYITSFILEKIFTIKLWDYSDVRFNIKGRVCLKFSIFWFIIIVFYLMFIQNNILKFIDIIDKSFKPVISAGLFMYFITDTLLSSKIYFIFARSFNNLKEYIKQGFEPADFLSKFKLPSEIKLFLLAMKKFPNLAKLWNSKMGNLSSYTNSTMIKWIESFLKKESFDKLELKKPCTENIDFMELAGEIINNEKYQELKNYRHHDDSIYNHSLQVAWLAYKFGKVLNVNLKELVRGALLHDFFLYNWRTEKLSNGKLHAFEHPKEAFKNSSETFGHITIIEKDIILKHMWPLTVVPPNHIEAFIVCISDKIVATKEFSKEFMNNIGSDKKINIAD